MAPKSQPFFSLPILTRATLLFAMATVPVVFGNGCDCDDILTNIDDAGPGTPLICSLSQTCADGTVLRYGKCVRSGCEADTDCCPGTRCRLDLNTCWPYALDNDFACETDTDCDDPAQRCREVTLAGRDPILTCIYEACQGASDCGPSRTCYHGSCVAKAPCGGGCPEGSVCDTTTGTCADIPDGSVGCSGACDGLLVLADPSSMSGEQCCPTVCQCKGLPPIVPRKFGKYASIAVAAGSELLVSAYDSEYGDLVVAHHKVDGSLSRVVYVDGIPVGAPIVADRSGPRGGIGEPGPNVGTHTSIAVDGQGMARVAYHDVDNRSLKVALQSTAGWQTHTIDTPTADGKVGTFTDIAVDAASGIISISYLALDITGAPGIGGKASALKVARSRSATPTSATDWDLYIVDARPAFDACAGACTAAEACVLDDGPVCRTVAPSCPQNCSASQTCTVLPVPEDNGTTATCLPPPLPKAHDGLPRARGLHTKVIVANANTFVSYYDSIDGDVRLATLSPSGTVAVQVIDGDGQNGRRSGDVGRNPSVTAAFGDLVVVYSDFSRHDVRAWRGQPGSAGTYTVVDSGKVAGEPGKRFVGAGAQAVTVGDRVVVVYQDASALDVQMATGNGTIWAVEGVIADGAHGFYSDVAVASNTAFIVSVLARLDARDAEDIVLSVLPRPLP
jgi:hypothetical protein